MLSHPEVDVYPSRVLDEPRILDREDPVVYGDPAHGPLTQEQVASYQKNGFLFIDSVFSPAEVEAIQQAKDILWDQPATATRPEVIREPESDSIRSIFAVHRDDAYFKGLSQDPRLVHIATQLLGGDVYIHQSRINFKSGFSGKEFYWHSDFETWHVEDGMPRMRALSMSLALTENLATNGPVMVIPGSHRHYVTCVGQTPENHYTSSLKRQVYGTPDRQSLSFLVERGGIAMPTGRPGSLLIFDCNIMHGSNSNITPYPRSNLFLVYNSVENRLQHPFGAPMPRPDYIATR